MENRIATTAPGTIDPSLSDRSPLSSESQQPKLETTRKLTWGKHAHGPNFGHYVEGCGQCEKKKARGGFAKPIAKIRFKTQYLEAPAPAPPPAPPPAESAAATVTMTTEQLQHLLAQIAQPQGDLTEALKAFAIELRKPDPAEEAAKQAELERRELAKQRRIAEIRMEEESRRAAQDQCGSGGHQKENGKSAVVQGQVYNDGFMRPFCVRCNKQFPPIKATIEMMTTAG